RILDAGRRKALELRVEVPVEDMARLGEPAEIPSGPVTAVQRTSIWPAIHPRLLELIRSHRSTLIFVNSRRLAERLAAALNELAGEELVHAHHGSIAREQRLRIEDDLKSGRLPALVATSSLELGIDMGAIDLVIQVESPPSVATGRSTTSSAWSAARRRSRSCRGAHSRASSTCCRAATHRMSSRSCARAWCGTGPPVWCALAKGRRSSRSATAARFPTAASMASSSPAPKKERGELASSTRRWCSRRKRVTYSSSAHRAGASKRSRPTASSSRPHPACRGEC